MSDPFAYKEIGDPTVAGSKWGQTSGTSTDIIYPVSQLIDDNFKEGSTVSFNWRSDRYRHWSARNTRLMVEYEAIFGECNETCADPTKGPQAGARARPSRSLRMTSMPNSCLFSSQARFVQNNVTLETTNNLYEQTQLQLLLTSNEAGTKTSGSNMLSDLSKSKGLPGGVMFGSQADYNSNAYAMLPVEAAPYVTAAATGSRTKQDGTDQLGASMGKVQNSGLNIAFGDIGPIAVGADPAEIPIILSSDINVAKRQLSILRNARSGGSKITVSAGDGKFGAAPGVVASTVTALTPATAQAGEQVTITCADLLGVAMTGDDNAILIENALGGIDAIDVSTVDDVASAMVVRVASDSHKDTTPNAKHEILQQGFIDGKAHFQVSEPIIGLSTWNTNLAMGGGNDFQLHLTISPDYLKDVMYDVSGQMGCATTDGAAIRFGTDPPPGDILANQVYLRVKSVQLHVAYVHPAAQGGFIPKSISQKVHPIQVTTRQITSQTINQSFTVPVSTVAVAIFLRQQFRHICADTELDGQAKAAAGVNCLGKSSTATGNFHYDSNAIAALRDGRLDPRQPRTGADAIPATTYSLECAKSDNSGPRMIESSTPYALTQLQVQLADAYAPREALAQMDPLSGTLSRAWSEYITFISKNMGYRGSVMSYAQFCGYHNSNYASGPRAGDRGPFYVFSLQRPSGSLSVDLQVRGLLEHQPDTSSKMEMVVMAISESLYNVDWQSGSDTPVTTTINPLV